MSYYMYEQETSAGTLKAATYDDGCAQGIQIMLNGRIISVIDVLEADGSENPGEVRALIYASADSDEPTHCITIPQG